MGVLMSWSKGGKKASAEPITPLCYNVSQQEIRPDKKKIKRIQGVLMALLLGIEIAITFVLFLANGLFAASEISIVSARRSRLQQQIDMGNKGAQQALELAQNPDRFLATVQVGITLINT